MSRRPSSSCTISGPEAESKTTGPFAPISRRSTWALAKVAWPQRGTSATGVNQRSRRTPSESGRCTKAVSDRFISWAIRSRPSSETLSASKHTAAGLPPNGLSVNASTV